MAANDNKKHMDRARLTIRGLTPDLHLEGCTKIKKNPRLNVRLGAGFISGNCSEEQIKGIVSVSNV